jgi:hypothetical protein
VCPKAKVRRLLRIAGPGRGDPRPRHSSLRS